MSSLYKNHLLFALIIFACVTCICSYRRQQIKVQDLRCNIANIPNLIVQYEADNTTELKPGDYVENFESITYKCPDGYVLEGQDKNICIYGNWQVFQPKCLSSCSIEPFQSVTHEPACEFNGVETSCDGPIRAGTRMKLTCANGYRWPADEEIKEIFTCGSNGEWDSTPVSCEPICGTESLDAIPFLLGGEKINNSLVPWHVSIYELDYKTYVQICAGTIINARVIVSAAHCFWDTRKNRALDKSLIMVAAGKYYRDFKAREPQFTQFVNVSELIIPAGYNDIFSNYDNNIAILVLDGYLEFKSYIKPICIEWENLNNQVIKSGIYGRVADWGKSEGGTPRSELRILDLPTIDQADCIQKTSNYFWNYISNDTFCVGGPQDEFTLCQLQSGVGFAISKIVNDIKTHYLWGIVSISLTKQTGCKGEFIATLTNIQYHLPMITENELKYRPK